MFKGIEIYKGRSYAEKIAVLPSQVRRKIHYMVARGEHLTGNGNLYHSGGIVWGLDRVETFRTFCLNRTEAQ